MPETEISVPETNSKLSPAEVPGGPLTVRMSWPASMALIVRANAHNLRTLDRCDGFDTIDSPIYHENGLLGYTVVRIHIEKYPSTVVTPPTSPIQINRLPGL
jgi:hypothetical protein